MKSPLTAFWRGDKSAVSWKWSCHWGSPVAFRWSTSDGARASSDFISGHFKDSK